MTEKKKTFAGRANRERKIEDAVMKHRDQFGFAHCACLRNVKFDKHSGRLDVMLIPDRTETKLVLIEVKVASASDAMDRVVGQLLKYYVCAQRMGITGVQRMERYAMAHEEQAMSDQGTTPRMMLGTKHEEAFEIMSRGKKLKPEEIQLFIAMDGEPHPILLEIIDFLAQKGITIGVLKDTGRTVKIVK